MKKIISILFLFLIFFACYLVYNLTNEEHTYYLSIGDDIADNPTFSSNKNILEYNNLYINKDYRIIDLLNILKYNQEKEINNKTISIHQLLKRADVVILSIGMNDIYYKLNDNVKDIYTYVNQMVNNMEEIQAIIKKYQNKDVFVIGYYNINNKYNDIFTYLNYKIEMISVENEFNYLDLNDIFKNKTDYLENSDNFYLNRLGYEKINQLIVEILEKS